MTAKHHQAKLKLTQIDSTIHNSINLSIKFTMETSDKELTFLDVLIKETMKKCGWTFIASQQALAGVSNSCPAFQTIARKKCTFYLARITSTIVENQQQKLRHLSELNENLKNPVNIITIGIKKALEIPQYELRKTQEKQTDEVSSFISIFNPSNSPVYNIIRNFVEGEK